MIGPPYLNTIFVPGPIDWPQSELSISQALIEHPEDTLGILHIRRLCYYVQEKNEACLETCTQLLAFPLENDYLSEVYGTMAHCYGEMGLQADALAYYEKAIDVWPEETEARQNMGDYLSGLYQWDKAIPLYQRILELEPSELDALSCLAFAYSQKGEHAKARDCYQQGAEASPEDDYWIGQVAKMNYITRHFQEAEKGFKQQLALNPTSEDALYGLGSCLQEKGDFYMAMHYYTKALELNPAHARSLNNIGKLYFDFEGDLKKAVEMIEKAIEASEKDDTDLRSMAYLNLKRMYMKIADHDKADYYHGKFMESFGFTYTEEEDDDAAQDSSDEADD
jgi:tetratricopeptide (TPR) repeat protein